MALAVTLLNVTSDGWDTASDQSKTTASITPGANCFLVCLIGGVNDANGQEILFTTDSSLNPGHSLVSSGSGPTWTQRAFITAPNDNFWSQTCVWTASIGGTDPGSFTVTADWKSTYTTGGSVIAIVKFTGHDTGTSFAGATTLQASAPSGTHGKGARSLTLSASPATGDAVVALNFADQDQIGTGGGATFNNTARTWTELADGAGSNHQVAYNVGWSTGSTSTTVAWTDVNADATVNYSSSQVAIIVKVGAGGSAFVGTLVATSPVATATLVGTRTLPVFTGTVAATGPVATATLVGAFVPAGGVRTGTLVTTGPTTPAVLVGVFIPNRTGSLVVVGPTATSGLVGVVTSLDFTDDFNRADTSPVAGSLGANWNTLANGWYIASNKATKLALDHYTRWVQPMPSVDHFLEVDLEKAQIGQYQWMHIRAANNTPGTVVPLASYEGGIHTTEAGGGDQSKAEVGIVHADGTYTVLGRGTVVYGGGGPIVRCRLEAVGNKIRFYTDGNLIVEGTDSELTGLYVGFNCGATSNGTATYDNFRAGPAAAPPPPTSTGTFVATGPVAIGGLVGTYTPSGTTRVGVLVPTGPVAISGLVGVFIPTLVINADDFNRANTSTPGGLGSNWTDPSNVDGTANYHIAANRATKTSSDHFAFWKTPMGSADHYAEADVQVTGRNDNFAVVHIRRPTLTSTAERYEGYLHPNDTLLEIGKTVGGNYTTLVTGGAHTGTGKIRLQAVGNVVSLYLNGTLALTYTDPSPLTGTYVGFNGFSGATDAMFWDSFAAAVVTTTPTFSGVITTASPSAIASLFGVFALSTTARVGVLLATTPTATSNLVGTVTAPVVGYRYPAAISGRKIVDQTGAVYVMRTFSSWAMASNLTNAEITQALNGIAGRNFNSVNVSIGGGIDFGDPGWHRYTNAAGQNFWTGQPWQLATPSSPLGPAWSSVDWVMSESNRLGLTVNLSIFSSWAGTGAAPAIANATTTDLYNVGCAVAARYLSYPNIVWHVMFDDGTGAGSTVGQRIDAYFHGINDTEGASRRPVRWAEPNNGSSIVAQLGGFTYFNLSMNGLYSYADNSTELIEASYNEAGATAIPTGDVEPLYDGHTNGLGLRYRSWAVFLEGGSYINYGHEDWWPFKSSNPFGLTEGLTWQQVPDDVHTIQQSYIWSFIDTYTADIGWAPSNFVVVGTGSGNTRTAAGASPTALVAYFPTSRSITIDTTQLAGTGLVRIRWFDPFLGTYTPVVTGEAQTANRNVTYPGNHSDGTQDWVLVADLPDRTGVLVATGPSAISGLRGTVTVPTPRIGVLVTTGPTAIATLVGVFFIPGRTGVIAAIGPVTVSALRGTITNPVVTGVITTTGPVATAALEGRFVPVASVRTGVLVALGPAPSATLVGTFSVPFFFAVLVALGPSAISTLRGVVVNPIPLAGEWFLGATPIAGVRLGSNPVSAVYHGTNPVWGSGI